VFFKNLSPLVLSKDVKEMTDEEVQSLVEGL